MGSGAPTRPAHQGAAGELTRLQRLAGNAAVARSIATTEPSLDGLGAFALALRSTHQRPLPVQRAGEAPTTIPTGGTDVNKPGVVNRDVAPELRLRATPDTAGTANIVRTLPFNTHVQVVKSLPGDWLFVSTADGDLGYVASPYVSTRLPEPNASLHRVQGGVDGTAIAIAERYYKQYADDWGQDLRFYVNVLALVNKIPVPDTTAGWKEVQFKAGELRWIPSYEFARGMRGVVNSGSRSFNALDAIGLASAVERVGELWDDITTAVGMSTSYLGEAIGKHVEQALYDALYSLAVTLVGAVAILAISTAVGAAIGALFGGVTAAPGAAAGFEVGMVLLQWLGLAMLIAWVGQALWDTASAFGRFFSSVWNARGDRKKLDIAAHQFADAVGILLGKLVEAAVMYVASLGMTAGLKGLQNSKLGKAMGKSQARDWLTERVRKVQSGEAPIPGPKDVIGRVKRGVELYDGKKSPIGEFDSVDARNMRFVENKSASGLDKVNPKTGKAAQTEAEWAKKQITTKTSKRIDALAKAAGTRPTKTGSPTVPGLAEIQGLRTIHFKIDGNTPALRAAVFAELANLRAKFPDWTFTAEFGVTITAPPVPTSGRDESDSED